MSTCQGHLLPLGILCWGRLEKQALTERSSPTTFAGVVWERSSPGGFASSRRVTGRPFPPVRGPLGLPKRGLVAPGAGTEVPECVRLGPAVNRVWRGRPSSGGGSPRAACGCGCGGGILVINLPAVCGGQPRLPEFSHEFRPIACGARWLVSLREACCPWYCRATDFLAQNQSFSEKIKLMVTSRL